MMLSPLDDGRLLIVNQPDHGRLAGTFVARWGNEEFAPPEPFVSVVVACGGHEFGWWDWEVEPFLNTKGEVIDYYRSNEVLGQTWADFTGSWIERLARRDVYAGYLLSMHHEGLLTGGFATDTLPHMPDRSGDAVVSDWSKRQRTLRAGLMEEMKGRPDLAPYLNDESILRGYRFVQMGDQFSQIICNRHPFDSIKRTTGPRLTVGPFPVRAGVPDTMIRIEPIDEVTATVDPWPFDTRQIEMQIPARILSKSSYDSHDAFLADYLKADQVALTRVLRAI
jgi:hypothetical protein